MNRAVAELYAPDIITLATKPDTPRIPFKHEVFEEAVKWLHEQGRYSADMLADPHAHRLIEETYNALNGAIGVSITQETPEEMTYALRNNAFIFSGFKTHRTLSEVGLELTDDEGNLKPYAKVLEDVRRIDNKYNGAYLYAEYNHAVHTTQMAVKWQDFVRDGDEYNLQYRTAGDERVREAHIALDGVTLPPSDKFWDRYLPPNGWNCRCTVVQVLREDFPLSDSEEAIKRGDESTQSIKQQMFRFNAGNTLELFPPKHPYLPKGCGSCQRRLRLAFDKNSPQCQACAIIVKCWEEKQRSEHNRERLHYLHEMKSLEDVTVVVNGNGHPMRVGFDREGNKHLYNDTIFRSKTLQKGDLKHLDKVLATSTFVRKSKLSKPRTDNIKRFYYYEAELRGKKVYLNVGEREYVRSDGKILRTRILYSVTDTIKNE